MKKLALTCLLAASALLVTQTEAKAASSVTCSFATPGACSTTLGDWSISNFTSSVSNVNYFATFTDVGKDLDASFQFIGNLPAGSGSFSYELTYLGTVPLDTFVAGTTGTPSLNPPGVTVVGNSLTAPFNVVLPSATYSGSTSSIVSFLPDTNAAKILYSWNFASGNTSSITSQTSASDVPGPLPILGAASAFGFTRRMRQRIKAHA